MTRSTIAPAIGNLSLQIGTLPSPLAVKRRATKYNPIAVSRGITITRSADVRSRPSPIGNGTSGPASAAHRHFVSSETSRGNVSNRECEPLTMHESTAAKKTWIDSTVRPNAFVTILMPVTRTPRPHEFYLSLWTRQAEAALWGRHALDVSTYAERCLWFFVHETICQDWGNRSMDGKPRKLHHYHGLLRMPTFSFRGFRGRAHLMHEEGQVGRMFSIPERRARMQTALIEASKRTPEPYAQSPLDALRGADIDVRAYHPDHVPYMFKQLSPRFREHSTEQQTDYTLLRDHGLIILPHLPKKKEKN